MTAPMHSKSEPGAVTRAGASFWIAFVLGGAIMAFGIRGAVMDLGTESATDVARWVISADILHDFVIAPIAIGIGWSVGRLVPSRWRAPIQAGLVATGTALLIGWPGLRAYGRHLVPDNASVQALNYATSLWVVLAIIWGTVALWLTERTIRARIAVRSDH